MPNKPSLTLVKIGGSLIEDDSLRKQLLDCFSNLDGHKILVHGGGKSATALAERLNINTRIIDGRRITDAATLELITMVYAGKVSKMIVAELQAINCNAIGLCGADGNSICADRRPITTQDYGYVGDIRKINTNSIQQLIQSTFTPIFCALSHDGKGQLLNTNADTIAAEIAIAMSSYYNVSLYYCFEKKGVMTDITDESTVIQTISKVDYQNLKTEEIIVEGMLPKLENGYHALQNGVSHVFVGAPNMLDIKNKTYHTTLTL